MRVKPISGFYIDLKKSEKYSKVEECNMSTNCVGTYEQYKERLLKMKPNVYLHGQKIDRSNGKQGACLLYTSPYAARPRSVFPRGGD